MKSPESANLSRRVRLRAALALSLWALPAGAQYTAPGTPTAARPVPSKDTFQTKLKDSPWKAGPIRLTPWLGLQDASIINSLDNLGQTESKDFTLTIGAGLRGYLPAEPRVLWAAHALPEYVWWRDNEAKRSLNGRYGLALFVFFNRMTFELSQRRNEQQGFFSSELQALTTSQNDISTFSLDLDITNKLSLFGLASRQERRNEEDESIIFSALDRTEETGTIGLRYENQQGWTFELSHVDHSHKFAAEARALSNSGTSEVATIGLDRPGVGFRLTVAANDLKADEGSDFGTFDEATGAFDVLSKLHRRLAILGYLRRNQAYSIDGRYTQIVAERQGGRLHFDLSKVVLSLFAETGEDDFVVNSIDALDRLDDVTAYGATVHINLKGLSFSVRAARTEYDSNLDPFDRDVTSVNFGLKLNAISRFTSELGERLSLGSGDTDW